MPLRRTRGTKMVTFELPEQLVDAVKAFTEARGETFKSAIVMALHRHLAHPPPPPAPPAPLPPLPELLPGVAPARKRGRPRKQV